MKEKNINFSPFN